MPFVVYRIIDPRTGQPFYIGQTARMERRKREHMQGGTTSTRKRIAAILAENARPIFETLATTTTRRAAMQRERAALIAHVAEGLALDNPRSDIAHARNVLGIGNRPTTKEGGAA